MRTSTYLLGIALLITAIRANAQNPVAHWDFNENTGTTTTDLISSCIGTFVGDVTWTNDAHEGTAVSFSGSGEYIATEQTDLVETLRTADYLAFTAFFKTRTLTQGQQHIVWLGNTSGNGWGPESEIHISIGHFKDFSEFGSTILTFYYGSGDVGDPDQVHIIVADPEGLEEDKWHHVAGVISDAGTPSAYGELYLDGVLLTPLTTEETTYAQSDMASEMIDRDTWNSGILIGVGGNKTQRFFNGIIDDVKAFDQYLDSDAVNKDMIKTSSKIFQSPENALVYPNPVSGNLIYLKNFDEVRNVEIFNANGQSIKTLTPSAAAIKIDDLNKGIYLLKATSHNGTIATQRFIRQ